MAQYHTQSNWLGEPVRERIAPDPDAEYERMLDDLEIENALMARQMKLVPRAESAQTGDAA